MSPMGRGWGIWGFGAGDKLEGLPGLCCWVQAWMGAAYPCQPPGTRLPCCLARFLLPGCEKSPIKAHDAQISMSNTGGGSLHPRVGAPGGRCGFQPVPAAVEKGRGGDEKPLQPQSGAISLIRLQRWGCWGCEEQAPGSTGG